MSDDSGFASRRGRRPVEPEEDDYDRDTDADDFAVDEPPIRRGGDSNRPARSRVQDGEENAPRRKRKKKKKRAAASPWVYVATGAGILVALIVLFLIFKPKNRMGAFADNMEDYLRGPVQSNAPVPMKGKLVVVSQKERGLDDLHFDLPSSARANSPGEVQLVARVVWGAEKIGQYSNGAPGYVHQVQVLVFDVATRKIVGNSTFEGSEPPQQIERAERNTKAVYGEKPIIEVKSFLATFHP